MYGPGGEVHGVQVCTQLAVRWMVLRWLERWLGRSVGIESVKASACRSLCTPF